MIDELLGRAELKARIEELEEENHHLKRRVEAEEERRSEAVSERQSAEATINQLEDKITQLEDAVSRARGSDSEALSFREVHRYRQAKAESLIERLNSYHAPPDGAYTGMIHDTDAIPDALREQLDDRVALLQRRLPCIVVVDDTGIISLSLEVPHPPNAFAGWDESFSLQKRWIQPTHRRQSIIALVRSDVFALCTYDGETIDTVDLTQTAITEQHSKGGFSQSRFERRRDQQIETHIDSARSTLKTFLTETDTELIDTVVVLGEQTLLSDFDDLADHMETVVARGEPEKALQEAVTEFYTVRVSIL